MDSSLNKSTETDFPEEDNTAIEGDQSNSSSDSDFDKYLMEEAEQTFVQKAKVKQKYNSSFSSMSKFEWAQIVYPWLTTDQQRTCAVTYSPERLIWKSSQPSAFSLQCHWFPSALYTC